ncbi:uncharacterized protein C2845_PM01G21700 [Panicum miliaceum]|uniref:Uncharacterized protein n=1 Tax=Panicum miliaceum TaxID=4540 RepID=A0A3L6TRQ4_PANMI|nr:uncharacterized protein C2845_PM01G21700 [Panicum miliaceum]
MIEWSALTSIGVYEKHDESSFFWRGPTPQSTGLNGPAHLAAFPCFFLRLPRFLFHPRRDRWATRRVVDQAVRPRIKPKRRSASKVVDSWFVTSSFLRPFCRRRPSPGVDGEPPGAEASAARVPDGEPLQRKGAAGLHRIRRRMRRRHRRWPTHLPRYDIWASASYECYKRRDRCLFWCHKLRTSGFKNIEAGIGCGVGIGYGFGIGIALKPRVLHGIQSSVGEIMSKLTSKLKDTPDMLSASNPMACSLSSNQQTHTGMHTDLEAKTAESNLKHTTSYEMSRVLQPTEPEALTGSRTEKVIANFLQNPLFQNDTKMDYRDAPGNLQGMDNVLQLVLKHQRVIEDLREENENLRQILVEELKVSPTKLQIDRKNGVKAYYPCSDCFECRRRSRKTTR